MLTQDKCCTIVPYFSIKADQLDNFKALCEQFVAKTQNEPQCLYYGFSFTDNQTQAHCREGYEDADALLHHLENVGSLLEQALEIATLDRLEVHGTNDELAKLREPLAAFEPQFFVLEYGFRR